MKFGSFDTTSSGWSFRSSQGAFAIGERDTSDYSSAPAGYKITCITAGSQPDNIQLFTMPGNYVKITAGKQYKLTFRAKSDGGNITPTISLMKRLSPGTAYDTPKEVAISGTWETYTITFTASTTDDAARITFYLGEMVAGATLHIDSVSFKEATETSGNVRQTYYYDAFGNITEQSGDVDNNITYAGYQYDKETGLYYLNSRMYDSKIARFLQEDTYTGDEYDPLSLNLYTYCANDPIMYDDPTGHIYLQQGYKGDQVKATQEMLLGLGYDLGKYGADGSYGSATEHAVDTFQSNYGITQNGIVADRTLAVLQTAYALKDLPASMDYVRQSAIANALKTKNDANNTSTILMSQGTFNAAISSIERLQHFSNGGTILTGVSNNQVNITGATVNLESGSGQIKVLLDNKIQNPTLNSKSVIDLGGFIIATRFLEKPTNNVSFESVLKSYRQFVGTQAFNLATVVIGEGAGKAIKVISVNGAASTALEGGVCFTEDTLIDTKDGHKFIKDIKPGDEVYSENPETGEKGLKKVKNVFVKETDKLIHISAGNSEIKATPTHPFWVVGKGWTAAGELKIGDKLKLYSGDVVKVKATELEQLKKKNKVYNFEVEDWHTYFVSENDILVHNACEMNVYRGGNDFTVKPGEVKIDKSTGLVKPERGVSLNTDASKVSKFGGSYKIDSMPEGLKIKQVGSDLGHYEIVPEYPMSPKEFQEKLNQIKTSPTK